MGSPARRRPGGGVQAVNRAFTVLQILARLGDEPRGERERGRYEIEERSRSSH